MGSTRIEEFVWKVENQSDQTVKGGENAQFNESVFHYYVRKKKKGERGI